MSNKMLIDATHPEETRVVVLRGNRVEEFDFEAADRQQLRGNIYLAKVTRVEPSLQAAFVEYGGNRHGFLAFSEIHPDYYQIPVADRKALLEEHAAEVAEEVRREARHDAQLDASDAASGDDFIEAEQTVTEAGAESSPAADHPEPEAAESDSASAQPAPVEQVGAEDALEEVPERRKPRPRQYKIQEVIKRRQVLLVQVVKEERGSKGAALTTFLSLAGRYSVLMPNTARGGGISRKITNAVDRKRLKSVASELEVPEGMGVILRTAGANRTKTEIKRDFEYLLRLWENVRELTLRSTAPKLVYEEGSLIKRSIRDLYSREIDQIVVAGDEAYREAKDFMRMLMPSHARNVQPYRDDIPIFSRNGVETQLDAMFSPQVTLRSGGYIVINQTEALVAIDVNSGRSTREHSIEDTALNTNLEAAEEVSRQLRLRDLAGLIVIDFIDMEENRNNRAVERKLKDCLRADRARIQLGRIPHFGLMEMSRQRIRTGVLESSTVSCPHCRGIGQVRSISSLSLQILRALEDHLLRHNSHHLVVRTRPDVALYVLNQKRRHLAQLEGKFGLSVTVVAETPHDGTGFILERGEAALEPRPIRDAVTQPTFEHDAIEDSEAELLADEAAALEESEEQPEPEREREPRRGRGRGDRGGRAERTEQPETMEGSADREPSESEGEDEGRDKRRRRRRRRGGAEDRGETNRSAQPGSAEDDGDDARAAEGSEEAQAGPAREQDAETRPADEENGADARRRRRGRRGGRRRGRGRDEANGVEQQADANGNGNDYPADQEFGPGDADAEEGEAVSRQDDGELGQDRPALAAGDGSDLATREAGHDRPEIGESDRDPSASEDHFGAEQDSRTAAEPVSQTPVSADGGSGGEDFQSAPVENGGLDDQPPASNENVRASEPAAREPEPAQAEDTGPKRTGWWSRRSLF